MKRENMKRMLALVLALVLVFALAGCAGGGTTSSTPESSTPESSAPEESTPAETGGEEGGETGAEHPGLTPYDEPVTISWAVQASPVQQFIDGDTYENNVWSRLIKEKLNIDLTVAFSADTSTDAFTQKANTLLASGEFPDILRYDNRTFFKQAQQAGYIQSIDQVFHEYATPEVLEYETKYADSFKGVTVDGELYAFPYMNDNFHQAFNLWIRDDWLENTNTTPPTTIDELVELARIYTEEDPDGNGVNDTFGLALAGTVTQNNYGTLAGLANAYGVPGFTQSGVFYRGEDGKITFAWIQPEMKEVLSLLNDMYTKGYINPEFTADDVASMEDDVTNGNIGMAFGPCWGTWHPYNLSYQGTGVITRPYPIPNAEGHTPKIGINSNQTGDLFMVSATCENPEAAIKILNLYEATAISGSSEEFAVYWANEQYRFCPTYIGIPTELFAPQVHAALKAGSSDGLVGTALEYYNYVVGFEDGSLADDTNAYGTWGQMYLNGQGGSMKIDLDYQANGWTYINVMANELPGIWVQNSSVLGDMVNTAFVDIIVGNQPVEYFDTFVENWLAAGGQQTLDELEVLYPAE